MESNEEKREIFFIFYKKALVISDKCQLNRVSSCKKSSLAQNLLYVSLHEGFFD